MPETVRNRVSEGGAGGDGIGKVGRSCCVTWATVRSLEFIPGATGALLAGRDVKRLIELR